MKAYHELLLRILKGEVRDDRTGTGTVSVFGDTTTYDLRQGLPVVTTKRIHLDSVIYELLWMLEGRTNVGWLNERGVTIWDEWADSRGYLGPIYGQQWRSWGEGTNTIDQIQGVIDSIQINPYSRRHIVSAWNVSDLDEMALPPCHLLFQFYVSGDGHLDLQLYQRSADAFLGVPFNIASYSILLSIIAKLTNLKPRYFKHVLGDAHIYSNHLEQVKKLLSRDPEKHALPTLVLGDFNSIDFIKRSHIHAVNYESYPAIKAPVAV